MRRAAAAIASIMPRAKSSGVEGDFAVVTAPRLVDDDAIGEGAADIDADEIGAFVGSALEEFVEQRRSASGAEMLVEPRHAAIDVARSRARLVPRWSPISSISATQR